MKPKMRMLNRRPNPWSFFVLAFASLCPAPSVLGCKDLADYREACRSHDDNACQRACQGGALGEDGCIAVARSNEQNSYFAAQRGQKLEQEGFASVARLAFGKACAGGEVTGCLDGAAFVEMPYTPGGRPDLFGPPGSPGPYPAGSKPEPLATIPDRDAQERVRLYDLGCKLKSGEACFRLGMSQIGADTARATEAFETECMLDGRSRSPLGLKGECKEVRREIAARADAHRARCTKGDPVGCERLARLFFYVDTVRAPAEFAQEVAVRGAEIHPLGASGYVIDAIRRLHGFGGSAEETQQRELREYFDSLGVDQEEPAPDRLTAILPSTPIASPKAGASNSQIRLGALTIKGSVESADIEREINAKLEIFRSCYQRGLVDNPTLQGRVMVRFVLDRSGHAWEPRNQGADIPDSRVIACVVRAFYAFEFPRPASIATIVAPVMMFPSGKDRQR